MPDEEDGGTEAAAEAPAEPAPAQEAPKQSVTVEVMRPEPEQDRVLIVDFGSQVTQLIARRVREAGVYSEIVPYDKAEAALAESEPRAIILSGGPASVHETGTPRAPQALFNVGVPVLGICYGEQAMVAQMGGGVEGGHHREFGRAELEVTGDNALFDGVWKKGEQDTVWMSHGDRVTRLPSGFKVVGVSKGAPFAAVEGRSMIVGAFALAAYSWVVCVLLKKFLLSSWTATMAALVVWFAVAFGVSTVMFQLS